MRKFKFVLPDNKKTNYTWNSQDTSVPEGKKTYYIYLDQLGYLFLEVRKLTLPGTTRILSSVPGGKKTNYTWNSQDTSESSKPWVIS